MSVRARPPFCGLDASMEVISGKWKVLILWALRESSLRFGALKRQVPGVSEKVLTRQLRELEEDRVVSRVVHDERAGLRVEYSLTTRGADLYKALEPLGAWGRRYLAPSAAVETISVEARVPARPEKVAAGSGGA